ncbi:TadE/TadG family type IV pilus assembly protein [Actinomadura harenae]|nr:TadE/TadG family type IV pilus assembly protein [Actinomadura harenae]
MRRWRRDDDGSMSLEMVFATPIVVAFLLLLAGAGRMVDAKSQVDGAARDAARAASTARGAGEAARLGMEAAQADLQGHHWCAGGPQVTTDTSAWGAGGRVAVSITCHVDLSDMAFIGLPGTKSITGKAVAPIDTYTYRGEGTVNGPGGAGG